MIVKTYQIWAKEGDALPSLKLTFHNEELAKIYKIAIENYLQMYRSLWFKQYDRKTMGFQKHIIFTKGDEITLKESLENTLTDIINEPHLEVQNNTFQITLA